MLVLMQFSLTFGLCFVFSIGCLIESSCRSKGFTGKDLASLNYSDMVVFRPAFIQNAVREQFRIKETILS